MNLQKQNILSISRWLIAAAALAVAVVLLAVGTPGAAAQTPTPTPAPGEFGYGSCIDAAVGKTHSCGAKDIGTVSYQVLNITGQCSDSTSTVTVTMKGLVTSGSTTTYDVAFWVNVNGGNAVTDTTANACYRHVLNPVVTSSFAGLDLTGGEGPYKSVDGDFCGDIASNDGANHVNFIPLTLPCVDTNNNGALDFSICLGAAVNQQSSCTGWQDALPGTTSKCQCYTGEIPVTTLKMTITKSCTPNILPYDATNRTIACTINYKNNSTIAATGFQLVDDYDQTKGSVSNISSGGALSSPLDTITWTLPTVAAGGTGSVTYNYTINTGLSQGTVIKNTARLYFRIGTGPYTLQDIASSQSILLGSPMAVTLASFTAAATGDGVTLAWETVSESNNAGFNVYRATSDAGPWVKLNAALIPAAAPGSSEGHAYTWTDATALPGTYWYMLEDVATDGAATQHPPVQVTVGEPNAVGLAAFGATATPALAGLAALALAALAAAGTRKRS